MNNENFNNVDPNANSPLMQLNQEAVSVEQPMVPQENPIDQVEPSPMKPKKPIGLFVLVGVLLVGIGFALGFFVPKLFSKEDNNTKLEEKKDVQENPKTEIEEEPVEEPTEEPVDVPEEEEPAKIETEVPEEKVETGVKRDKTIKESSLDVKLNGSTYSIKSVYFTSGKDLYKDVYFNNELVIKESAVVKNVNSKDVNTKVNNDITFVKNSVSTLNDTKSSDQYLILYNNYQILYLKINYLANFLIH